MKNSIDSMLVEVVQGIVSEHFHKLDVEFDERVRKVVEGVTHPEPLMTRKEAAQFLNCSMVTIHAMMNDGRLPYTKLGASTRFNRADVEKLAKASRRAGL